MPRVSVGSCDSLSLVGKQMLPLQAALPWKQAKSIPDPCRGQRTSCLQPVSWGRSGSVLGSDTKSVSTASAALATQVPRELLREPQQRKWVQRLECVTTGRQEAVGWGHGDTRLTVG